MQAGEWESIIEKKVKLQVLPDRWHGEAVDRLTRSTVSYVIG